MKVGIIIPYKEDRGWLNEAKESIARQTYAGEGNIKAVYSQSDDTAGYNFNKGIEALDDCDLIRYLCEDDRLTPSSIEDSVNYFKTNPDIDFIHSNAINFWHGTKRREFHHPATENPTLEDMLTNNRIHGGTVVYRARCFDNSNVMNEELWTGEEYEFNMRLLKQGFKLGYMDEITYLYRRHSKQKSLGNPTREYQEKRKKEIEKIRESILRL